MEFSGPVPHSGTSCNIMLFMLILSLNSCFMFTWENMAYVVMPIFLSYYISCHSRFLVLMLILTLVMLSLGFSTSRDLYCLYYSLVHMLCFIFIYLT